MGKIVVNQNWIHEEVKTSKIQGLFDKFIAEFLSSTYLPEETEFEICKTVILSVIL